MWKIAIDLSLEVHSQNAVLTDTGSEEGIISTRFLRKGNCAHSIPPLLLSSMVMMLHSIPSGDRKYLPDGINLEVWYQVSVADLDKSRVDLDRLLNNRCSKLMRWRAIFGNWNMGLKRDATTVASSSSSSMVGA